jgi:hypothetical protein
MKELLSADDFNHIAELFDHQAFRLEVRDSYFVEEERESLESFLKGSPRPIRHPMFPEWLNSIRRLTARGKRIERVRVYAEPPTDYQRWAAWHGGFNETAGEVIRYISRSVAARLGLPIHDGDWWLLDSERVAVMEFSDLDVPLGGYIDTAPDLVARCREWRSIALANSVEYDRYRRKHGLDDNE